MRAHRPSLIALGLLLSTSSFAPAEITGSAHDFTAQSWGDQEICKPCHTPHNAVTTSINGNRLWAHTLSSASYFIHQTESTDAIADGGAATISQAELDDASRLCLSCHDGTVALDSFMKRNGPTDGMVLGTPGHGALSTNLGVDLTNDHPVGYRAVYKENLSRAGHFTYRPIAAVRSAGLIFATSPETVPAGSLDQSGRPIVYSNWPAISCITCHDVHNQAGFNDGLLRISNNASAMCLTCHDF